MELKNLVKKVLRYNKNVDINKLEKAYKFAEKNLGSKKRLSGGLWYNHYLEVAFLVADLKVDDNTLIAALLHGILNRTDVTEKQLTNEFGTEVTNLVKGLYEVNLLKKNITNKGYDFESLRKVLLAASKDIRTLLIKLCDKISNMRELDYLPKTEQKRISQEVMDIYAPLAYRLGLGRIKGELEDLAFKYLEPGAYKDISKLLESLREKGKSNLAKTKKLLDSEFEKVGMKIEVQSRVKHIYSIYKKILEKPKYSNQFHDVLAIRIITKDITDCYNALRIVHNLFRPIPDLFKDYIALPKPNGYQSLHTAVFLDEGSIMEIQIRTQEMHEIAEEGIAAHFNYKGFKQEQEFDKKLSWLKQLMGDASSNKNIDMEFFSDQIYAFTPKGKMIELPSGSSPLDFAYAVHTELGSKCVGAKVNEKLVPLKTEITNGDVVEIITSKTKNPNREWLKFVKTSKAKAKIKHDLKEHGEIPTSTYYKRTEQNQHLEMGLIQIEGMKFPKIKFAHCCHPLPGDLISSVSSGMNKVSIHKNNCESIKDTKKIIKCSWMELKDKEISLAASADDRQGLFAEILNAASSIGLNISNTKGKSLGNNQAECDFTTKVKNLEQLNTLINRIKKVRGVRNVHLTDL